MSEGSNYKEPSSSSDAVEGSAITCCDTMGKSMKCLTKCSTPWVFTLFFAGLVLAIGLPINFAAYADNDIKDCQDRETTFSHLLLNDILMIYAFFMFFYILLRGIQAIANMKKKVRAKWKSNKHGNVRRNCCGNNNSLGDGFAAFFYGAFDVFFILWNLLIMVSLFSYSIKCHGKYLWNYGLIVYSIFMIIIGHTIGTNHHILWNFALSLDTWSTWLFNWVTCNAFNYEQPFEKLDAPHAQLIQAFPPPQE